MSIYNLYSKQRAVLAKDKANECRYDLPSTLRVQISQILDEIAPLYGFLSMDTLYREINEILCREYGKFKITEEENDSWRIKILNLFLKNSDVDQCLDIIQLGFHLVSKRVSARALERQEHTDIPHRMVFYDFDADQNFPNAIVELNHRFSEHNVGYRLADAQIMRIDSEVAYQQFTLPVLKLLKQPYLIGAEEEFSSAQEHYRHFRFKECLNECLKAFESTMKAICHKRGWVYDQNDTAKKLILICEKNKLFPVFMESHLTGLRTTLESGVPTARNKTSGHGQGASPIKVSEEFATYILNLTASNIRFLASSEQQLQ